MNEKYMNYPFKISGNGKISPANEEKHIKDLIEQILFTDPRERVNLPDFGCGLKSYIFAPNDRTLKTTLRLTIISSVQKWLSHLIIVEDVSVDVDEEELKISIKYTKIRDMEENLAEFIKTN
jgi:phage baseplate assembly protein W